MGRALTSEFPLKVIDHTLGLKVVIESLAWVCEVGGEQMNKSPGKGTNETDCYFPAYLGKKVLGQSHNHKDFILCRSALPVPAQVGGQRSHWKGNRFLLVSKRNYVLLCWNIGSGIGRQTGGWAEGGMGYNTRTGTVYIERVPAAEVDP